MTTAYQAIVALAQLLGSLVEGTTDGAGSTTTTVDSLRLEATDYWNGGTIFKPETSQSRLITDFVAGTITHAAFPLAVGNAKAYAVFGVEWPRYQLFQAVSRALAELRLPAYDVSLTVVGNQRVYTLPTAVAIPLTLDIARNAGEPYDFQPWYSDWRAVGNELHFAAGKQPQETGRIIRLGYMAPHAAVTDDAGVIDGRIPLERLTWTAAVHAWRWRAQRGKGQEATTTQLLNEAIQEANRMRMIHPLPRLDPYPRLPL